ncbi:Vigilin 1 [Sphaceloma murrayae]|uniref:Vigilin 1 n=1 Tax=Sphaceloma murrayae TaxID=2082308 RepID=A0A2K1QX92_9PEZI|nr:Vigilin 1 [Sphaceloma murrayae]
MRTYQRLAVLPSPRERPWDGSFILGIRWGSPFEMTLDILSDRLSPEAFGARIAGQLQSPFFNVLPPEIRNRVLEFVLAACEHPFKRYNRDSIWRRPDHEAPLVTHTEVLRTCKRLYSEGRQILLSRRNIVIYLTTPLKRPTGCLNPFHLEQLLRSVPPFGLWTFRSAEIFADLDLLSDTTALQDLFDLAHFRPRSVKLVIRHTGFTGWAQDDPLSISASWARLCVLPSSVEVLRVTLESLERKALQVDFLAKAMVQSWTFLRADGRILTGDSANLKASVWQGRSTLNDRRWIRDESSVNTLHYHVVDIAFTPVPQSLHFESKMNLKDLTVPDQLHRALSNNGASVRVADHQFRRMLDTRSRLLTCKTLNGNERDTCPGGWPREGSKRGCTDDEMDPIWLFPQLDMVMAEPSDRRFGGRKTGYYHLFQSKLSSLATL